MKKKHSISIYEKNSIIKNLNRLIKKLSNFVDFDSSILFGSFLKSNEFNDIDILLIKNNNLNYKDFISLYSKIIEINESDEFKSFYLTYYDSPNIPKNKIKISLELDSPVLKPFLPVFYDNLFFKLKSFKVIFGNLDENIYLDKNIVENSDNFKNLRKIIEFLHTSPSLKELEDFVKDLL